MHVFSSGTVAVTILLGVVAPASAQSAGQRQPAPCTAAEHRQFDFWIGEWTVTRPDGKPAGTNRITKILNGCVLLEEWTGAGGGMGKSFNLYDRRRRQWHQTWVDGNGGLLQLTGGLNASGAMVMSAEQPAPSGVGSVRQRITWSPDSPNEVRQHWEQSTDSGTTWTTVFDGRYRRAGAARQESRPEADAGLQATPDQAPAQDVQRQIERDVWIPLLAASNAFDADRFLAVQSPDLVRVATDANEVYGFARYEAQIREGFARARSRGVTRTSEVRFLSRSASGNLAFESGYFRSRADLPDGTVRISYTRFEFVLRKEEGGWRILLDKDMSDGGRITEQAFLAASAMASPLPAP